MNEDSLTKVIEDALNKAIPLDCRFEPGVHSRAVAKAVMGAIDESRPPPDLMPRYSTRRLRQEIGDAVAAERARSEARLESARQFVKRHPALSLIDLAEFEAFLMIPTLWQETARPVPPTPGALE